MLKINIQDKLKEKGLNKNQFAKLMQIGYPAACALYDGTTTRISFDTLESICKVLDCSPVEILVSDDPQMQRLLAYASKINELNNKDKSDTFGGSCNCGDTVFLRNDGYGGWICKFWYHAAWTGGWNYHGCQCWYDSYLMVIVNGRNFRQ